jgi:squalene-hopene/tetraprenyl-beta-curcumene cyclase
MPFDRSSADITAHAVRAFLSHIPQPFGTHTFRGERVHFNANNTPQTASPEVLRRTVRAASAFLGFIQSPDGSWHPLWFGNQHAPNDENPTYGTARVLAAYRDAGCFDTPEAQRGLNWLRNAQNPDGGWGAGSGTPSSVEETALAIEILCADPASHPAALRGLTWLMDRVEDGTWREPAPIGFYFARLWYFERLYPLIFSAR